MCVCVCLSVEGWCCPKCRKEALPFFDSSSLSNSDVDSEFDQDSTLSFTDPSSRLSSASLRILYTNCRSLTSNLDSLRAYTTMNNPDIIAICESWLDDSISDLEIFIPNYYVIRRDRSRKGGGILLYIKDNIPTLSIQHHSTLELLFVELTLKQGPLSIGLLYRPPSADRCLTELELFLQSLSPSKLKSAVLLGDFNIDLLSSTPLSHEVTSTMLSYHLHQVVTDPTRIS